MPRKFGATTSSAALSATVVAVIALGCGAAPDDALPLGDAQPGLAELGVEWVHRSGVHAAPLPSA